MDLNWSEERNNLTCVVVSGHKVLGYLVIDSTIGGHASGGLRMSPDLKEDKIRDLARTMTLKYGFLGLPQGGAKAGVVGDPEAPLAERRQLLADFGKGIAPLLLSRAYLPGADLGTDVSDVRYLLETVGVSIRRRSGLTGRSGAYTALSVLTAAKQAIHHLGLSLPGRSAAIEGFGKVGGSLATLLDRAGARVVAVSTSHGAIFNPMGLEVARLTDLAARAGSQLVDFYEDAEKIERSTLPELPVDILFPCADSDTIRPDNASRISARVLSPGANNPFSLEVEETLLKQGTLCIPDFVANCGGTLGGRMEFAAVSPKRIAAFIDAEVGRCVASLLDEASRQHRSPRDIASAMALRRFEQLRRTAEHPSLPQRLFRLALASYRRGAIPSRVVGALSLQFFRRALE